MKLELLIEGTWVDFPAEVLDGFEKHYSRQGTPIHFDSEKYQHYVFKLNNSSSSYSIYRIRKDREEK